MNELTPEIIRMYIGYGLGSFALGWSSAFLFTTFKKLMEKI